MESEKEIPKGWIVKKISELTISYSGGTPSTLNKEYWNNDDVPWIKSGEIKNNILKQSQTFISKKGFENSSTKLYPPNTVLVAITGATTGKTAFLMIEACGTQNVFGILPCRHIIPKYMWYYMQFYYKKLIFKVIGTAQKHVNGTIIKNTPIIFPSLNEQKRIVEKIEELFSLVDSTKEILEKIKILLKQYRQSLLKSAFEGKLTEYNLKQTILSEIFMNRHGDFLPKSKMMGGIVAVYGGNGITGYHNESNVNDEGLVIGRVGAHCGNVHHFSGKSWITDNTIGLIPKIEMNTRFFLHQLKNMKLNELSGGSGQPYITGKILSELILHTTNITEQNNIVAKIEEGFSLIEKNEQIVDSLLLQYNQIKNSILKQAFEGKLVHQDPNDEPAEILLQKIKQEKQLIQKQKPSRSTKNVK